jgi:glucose/arabinose dehydrogenase
MTSKDRYYFGFTLIGLVLLITACSQARPTAPPGTVTPQPSQLPSATPDSPAGQAEIPEPAPTDRNETIATPPTLSTEKTPAPLLGSTNTPQATALPTLPPTAFPPDVSLEPILSGFELPVFVTHSGEEPSGISRLFVVEKEGRIHLVENGVVQTTPFLDITDRVGSQRNEQGLLSVVFAPDFTTREIFYVNYTDKRGDTIIARYRLLEGDPRQADPNSEQKILQIEQPAANHNGGQIQFGPDGYLYIGTGDGGQAGDPWGNAQNRDALLGKMLRIDVTETDTYTIPGDNPFVDQPGTRPEIWATGLRNPWRFSFDQATGDLYIADVGQNLYEELNFQSATSTGGENYGWDVMEASHCFEPPAECDSDGLTLPVAEYDRGQGCSITGGYVYRGASYPQMTGVYFFGDFCTGNVWGLRQVSSGEWEMALLLDTDVNISSFGEDASGEIYVVGYGDGTIFHLVASP